MPSQSTLPARGNGNERSKWVIWSAIAIFSVAALAMTGCEPSVPDGRIRVKNDSRDREYNVVTVSGGGAYCSLKPNESCMLPKGTGSFVMSRRYQTFTRTYTVKCPQRTGSGINVKLIDVHLNRIAGGCKTVSATGG